MNRWLRSVSTAALPALFFLGGTAGAGAQTVESDALRVELGGRVQVQGATSSCSDYTIDGNPDSACFQDVPTADLFMRRLRLRVDVEFNRWISARFQPDFARLDEFRVADAYGRLNLNPDAETTHARITIGHFKRPFDGFQLHSSTQILTIERALLIPGLLVPSYGTLSVTSSLSERDIGVMIDGGVASDLFHYWLGLFNGNIAFANRDDNNGKQLVGRAQVNLTAGDMPLALAVAGTIADRGFENDDGSLASKSHGAYEVFAELGDFGSGPHLMAGFVSGKNVLQTPAGDLPDLVAGDDFASMFTWQAIGGWKLELEGNFFLEAVEPVFRIMMADPNGDLDGDTVWGYTPGVQLFFDARNKVAINWDLVSLSGDRRGENSFRVQYQFYY
ncbi:MAG: porin [Gemmatimonadota bacterium]|nr:porin [Gemmatimonadota bacterium]